MRSDADGKSRTKALMPNEALCASSPAGSQLTRVPDPASIFTSDFTPTKPLPSFKLSH